MPGTLGTISGTVRLDVRHAVASYALLRAQNASTLYAMRGASAAFIAFGKGATIAGLALVAVFAKAVTAAAEFERKLDFFGAVSNSTAAQMDKVREKILQLGRDTIYSADQIAEGFIELGKAGVSAEQILQGVGEAVTSLGAAADIPLAQAAMIITSAVQTFDLAARDATHVADLLAGAANASIVEVEDLGVSLKYVGGVAAAISIPIEDVIDALSLLGKAGIRGSTAGTSLRQILVSLTGTSKKATGVLKQLGIITKDGTNQFFDMHGKAKPLPEIFQLLHDKTKNLTEAQRLAAFKTIFNNRALAAANILAREGAAGFAEMNAEISKTTAADVAHKRLDNLSGDIEILRGNIETLFIEAGAPFQEFLRGIVQDITKLVQAFGNLSPGTQKLIFQFIAIAGAALLFMGTTSMLVGTVLRFLRTMKLLVPAITLVWRVFKAVSLGIRAFGVATLLASGPIGWIVAGLIALGVAAYIAYKKSETFRKFINKLGASLVEAWGQAKAFFTGIGPFFVNLWNTVKNAFVTAWNAIINFFTNTIPNAFSTAFNFVKNVVMTAVNAVVGFFQQLPGRVLSIVSGLISGIVGFFLQLPGRLGYAIGFLIGTAVRLWLSFQLTLFRMTLQIINGVIGFFQALPGRAVAIWNSMVNLVVSTVTRLWTQSRQLASQIVNGVISFFQQLPGRAAALWSSLLSRVVSIAGTIRSRTVSLASATVSGIVNFFRSLPGRVVAFFSSLYTGAVGKLNSLKSAAGKIAAGIYNTIDDWVRKIPGAVYGALGRAISMFKGMVRVAFNAAKDFAGGLWSGFKDGLGIHSPSFIEKAMDAIVVNLASNSKTMSGQVARIQTIGKALASPSNMTAATEAKYAKELAALATNLQKELAAINKAKADLEVARKDIWTGSTSLINTPLGDVVTRQITPDTSESAMRSAPITFNVYNPVGEPAVRDFNDGMNRLSALSPVGS